MNVAVQPQIDEVAAIEVALDKLLTVAVEHRYGRRREPVSGKTSFTAAELMSGLMERLDMGKLQRRAHDLLSDPVGEALRQAVHTLGERLNEIGGQALMGDVCHRVAALDEACEGIRTDILDKRWDGIGGWAA